LLAGSTQESGYADGVGSDARFSGIVGVAADHAGNLYVVDGSHVRKVTPTGVVTTLTTLTPNNDPSLQGFSPLLIVNGVAADDSGNVFLGYTNTCVVVTNGACVQQSGVYRVDATGATSAINITGSSDGTGTKLGFVYDIAVDNAGNIYIAQVPDGAFGSLRRLSPGGDLTTMAGIFRPSSVAVDDAGTLYVIDNDTAVTFTHVPINPRVSKVDSAGVVTPLVAVLANANATAVASPNVIAVDFAGNLYVSDNEFYVMYKITPSGAVSTVVGTENVQGFVPGPLPGVLDAPRGVAVHGSDLYIGMSTAIAVVRNRP
jgi:sugar lactone lactonase YvrE